MTAIVLATACSTPKPAPKQAKVAVGAVALGCFAHSASRRAVACLTGYLQPNNKGGKVKVEYVGMSDLVPLDDGPITEAAAARIDETLAKEGFVALERGPVLAVGKPHDGFALEPSDGGVNFIATCASGPKTLTRSDAEHLARVTIRVKRLDGTTALIESIQREDGNEHGSATLFDLQTCKPVTVPDR